MAHLTEEMTEMLNRVMWVLATADESGVPNAVPIHFKAILADGRLMLVDNFMNKTVANIQANPRVSISVWESSSGYQFKGWASIEKSGANYDLAVEMVRDKPFNPKGVVVVEVDSIYLTTPGPQAGSKIE
jgi:hypothetical protein